MGFFKWLFSSSKTIAKVEIDEVIDGLDEDDKLTNLAVGDMMGGFDGMVYADMINEEDSAKTIFKVTYTDGSVEYITTNNGSSAYYKYMRLVK